MLEPMLQITWCFNKTTIWTFTIVKTNIPDLFLLFYINDDILDQAYNWYFSEFFGKKYNVSNLQNEKLNLQ
jgi:hypothetical protein